MFVFCLAGMDVTGSMPSDLQMGLNTSSHASYGGGGGALTDQVGRLSDRGSHAVSYRTQKGRQHQLALAATIVC